MSLELITTRTDAAALRPLFEGWPHVPYVHAPGATRERLAAVALDAFLGAAEAGAMSWEAQAGGGVRGAIQLERLAWDTEALGMEAARVGAWLAQPCSGAEDARSILLDAALDHARRAGVRYLLARVSAADLEGAHLLEQNGFCLVDGLLTFGAPATAPGAEAAHANGFRCAPFVASELSALEEIARTSFSIDRFHADAAIGGDKADALYRRWLRDSCGGFADCVLVAHQDAPAGFTTLKLDRRAGKHLGAPVGVVVLVATAAEARRHGAAAALTQAALEWFRGQGCAWVEVGTQLANIRASRVYQAAGFRLVGSSLTFRRLLE